MTLPDEVLDSAELGVDVYEAIVRYCARVAGSSVCDVHLPTGVRIYGQVAKRNILAAFDLARLESE